MCLTSQRHCVPEEKKTERGESLVSIFFNKNKTPGEMINVIKPVSLFSVAAEL